MAAPTGDNCCETGHTVDKTRFQWTASDVKYCDPKDVMRSSSFVDATDRGISWYLQFAADRSRYGDHPVLILSADKTSKEFSFRYIIKLTNEKGEEFHRDKFSEIKYIKSEDGEDWIQSHHIMEERGDQKWVSTNSIIPIDGFDLTNKLLIEVEVDKIGNLSTNSPPKHQLAAGIRSGSLNHHHARGHNQKNDETY